MNFCYIIFFNLFDQLFFIQTIFFLLLLYIHQIIFFDISSICIRTFLFAIFRIQTSVCIKFVEDPSRGADRMTANVPPSVAAKKKCAYVSDDFKK